MSYSFKNLYKKAKPAFETDKYIIYQRIKSKFSYSDNYLELKEMPQNTDEAQYFIDQGRKFFRDKGIDYLNLALPEKQELQTSISKYLIEKNFKKIDLSLYFSNVKNIEVKGEDKYEISFLSLEDYSSYAQFSYEIDIEYGGKEWADNNRNSIQEDLRNEEILQLIAKDGDRIIASCNVIANDDYFEIDNIYVEKNYRNQGIASSMIAYSIEKMNRNFIILKANSDDTPKYMYEKMGFEEISNKIFFLKNEF